MVIDEIHAYRGVFGSNLANVIRRLTRLCRFYGSDPQFICCSATIANPGELASTLIGRPVEVIDKSGAASGEKHIVFYNPPVVNKQLGVRKSVLQETLRISSMLVDNDISTIVFGKSRLTVEVLTRHLKERVKDPFGNAERVRGYRGGYLPTLRREIERGLRKGGNPRSGFHQRAGVGHRYRTAGCMRALRLSRFDCQHMAGGRPCRAAKEYSVDDSGCIFFGA